MAGPAFAASLRRVRLKVVTASVVAWMLVAACSSDSDEGRHGSDCPVGGAAGATDGSSSAGASGGDDGHSDGGAGGAGGAGGSSGAGETGGESGGDAGGGNAGGGDAGAHQGGVGGDGDGPVTLTPLTSARAAAGALHAALLVDTDVHLLSSMLSFTAEYALLTSLRRASSANGSTLPDPGSPLPAAVEVECPSGGSYVVSWHDAVGWAAGAVALSMQFHDCQGLDEPSGSSTMARENGLISVTLVPVEATSWRAVSVRLGDEEQDHVRELIWKSEGVVVGESSSSFEVTGRFMHDEELVGDFDYLINGHRTDRNYYTRAGDPTNTLYSNALTSTCDQVRVSGAREMTGADTRLDLRYHSGSIARLDEVPETTTTAVFSFHDLRLAYLARNSEGNESAQIDGIVSVTYPEEAQGCISGTYEYATTTPLLDGDTNRGKGAFPQFLQGQLELNRVALATFLRKQELSISLGNQPVSYRDSVSAKSELARQLECFVEF